MDSLRRSRGYAILRSTTRSFEVENMSNMVEPYTGDKPYIFISYCAADSEIAHDIIEEFRMRNYRVWYDAERAVNDYSVNTQAERLRNCAFFLCVLSEAYTNDPNCIRELYFALNNGEPVLPIMIEKFRLPEPIKYVLSAIQILFLSHFESVSKMIDRLCEVDDQRLKSCIDRPVRKPERKTGFCERLAGKRK